MKAEHLELREKNYISNEELVALYKKNKDINIRNKIIVNNIGLIYSAARKRMKNPTCYTLEDLVQEGVIGMMKGIERFDTTRDTSFSTYVYYWIVQQMDRALMNNGYMVRLPAYIYEKINSLSAVENNYMAKNEEIDLKELCNEANMTEQEYFLIHYYKKNYSNFTSLNSIINTDSDENYVELQDYIPCQDISVEDIIISESLKEQLIEILNTLSPKEKEVLELRFGLNGNDPLTLEAIGNKYDLTRERIRQIENKALKKLKRLNSRKGLKDYLLEY
ncbi:RNA polymerase sigma factor [[Clostridium] ultunense Esp]|uniref:RNA polymerase sigma factor n=1 Tax=[Clostridium] ultunense Esp TaxID=1288971 RepID=M1ZF92_9FIRM|nr:sigma-70 family RNA polymerase sigma factor [Schnuerera ultunensis]CCQ96778.1 RNA polymerase sigma factor [[Clostridium] ultunense Esp]SHD75542.1 RNA polymerase sigma factor [[Clostridium] ultunense Esp]